MGFMGSLQEKFINGNDAPGIIYYKVTPTWIRFTDLNTHPWDVKELTF